MKSGEDQSASPRRLRIERLERRTLLNSAPVAQDDVLHALSDASIHFDYLTLNDSDADGDGLSVVSASPPTAGTITPVGEGAFRFDPPTGFTGEVTFDYTVSDGSATDVGRVTIHVSPELDAAATRSALLAGVAEFSDPGAPGRLSGFGPAAAPVADYDGDPASGPMAVAANWGGGRVIAMPDHQWLRMTTESSEGTMRQFYRNSIEWLAGTSDRSIRIVVAPNNDSDSRLWLLGQGYTNVVESSDYATVLADADVLIGWLTPNLSSAQQTAIEDFVTGGGGLFLAEYGQGYQGYNGWWSGEVHEAPGNRLLYQAGIAFGPGVAPYETLAAAPSIAGYDAQRVIEILSNPGSYTAQQKDAAAANAGILLDALPPEDSTRARIDQAFRALIGTVSPTPQTPVTSEFEKSILTAEMRELETLPAGEVTAHRTAEAVYGAVPAEAERVVDQGVLVDTTKTGWLPTGYYAAPGELVTLRVPPTLVGRGYAVQISGHVDNTSRRDRWDRVPFGVDRRYDIDSAVVEVASAFGGIIYIDVGGESSGTPPRTTKTPVLISGAVAAPLFVLGETTNDAWVAGVRDAPAPYAELVSNGVALSVPSAWVRDLNDPERLMTYWDEVVAYQDWVGGFEGLRTGPDRINVDVQISAGLLHAGYPIQGPTWASEEIVDYDELIVSGNWGYFHELGHEMQRQRSLNWTVNNPWTFSGDVEVTVNIFANAALENQVFAPTNASNWTWSAYPGQVMARARDETTDPATPGFEAKNPYPFYFQLADGFGWEKYREVLSGYVADAQNNPSALPSNNTAEKDQWLIRWSEATGYDLTNYMVNRWRLEVSAAALDEVAAMGLPDWLPATTTIEPFSIANDESRDLPIVTSGISLDGAAALRTADAELGTLESVGGGNFRYTPPAGFVGEDVIRLGYRSTVGNIVVTEIPVRVQTSIPVIPGDFDRNGSVDRADHALWASLFGSVADDLPADANSDGRVDAADFTVWRDNLGASAPVASASAPPTPPASTAAVGLPTGPIDSGPIDSRPTLLKQGNSLAPSQPAADSDLLLLALIASRQEDSVESIDDLTTTHHRREDREAEAVDAVIADGLGLWQAYLASGE
ncbi:MAG: M60 family metallopeptidase [Planctomycetota bacterium]